MPCLMPRSGAFQLCWMTEVRSVLSQLPGQICCCCCWRSTISFAQACSFNRRCTARRLKRLLLSTTTFPTVFYTACSLLYCTCSITHCISRWKEMFGKQKWRSDSSLGIFGFSSKCFPPVRLCLQPAFRVPHGRDCWGPVGGEKSEHNGQRHVWHLISISSLPRSYYCMKVLSTAFALLCEFSNNRKCTCNMEMVKDVK